MAEPKSTLLPVVYRAGVSFNHVHTGVEAANKIEDSAEAKNTTKDNSFPLHCLC